ncbi:MULTISPECIES: hypothetical protein [unclassified Photobacterium]|uniref:tetratricopeptide repeat protein n=1 Tax=unclassified Photobacterium TaxID=2628852 RepID=UPI001EE104ED|nr:MULTISPECIES: hypothetical protein [unclassified Photobacterium]MCG3865479.1 sel1 repeat family protein [Photobacterium sp. Ph6]MCG3876988.1 sel1 repeat family protein [Photobacterium sp. Ph5]
MIRLLLPALVLFSGCSSNILENSKNTEINNKTLEVKPSKFNVTNSSHPQQSSLQDLIRKIESNNTYAVEKSAYILDVKKLAEYDPNAMTYIASLYRKGKLLPLSSHKAREYYKKAAEHDHILARYYYALMLIDGEGGDSDHLEAEQLLFINHSQDHATSSYSLAYLYFINDEYKNTIDILEGDNIKKNKENEYLLAISYLQANKNIDRAIALLHSSANKNHLYSHHTLGKIYRFGSHNVNADLNKSYYHFSQAAKDNNAKALYQLATLGFTYPFLIHNNYDIALKQLTLSAEKHYEPAIFKLAKLYDQGYQIKQNYELAFHWYKISADYGNNKAMYNLASMYANGDGVPESYNDAEYWLRKSAENGNQHAKTLLDP